MSATGASELARLSVAGDRLDVTDAGVLRVDGCDVRSLVERFGSPLYVIVEATLRENYRRIRDAFAARWPAAINVMYAIKSNDTLAIRAILSQEGAGGDCFGLGELHATIVGGADPRRVVMNGSSKTRAEIDAAIARGIVINLDSRAELPRVEAAARATGRRARVNLRLKLTPEALDGFNPAFFKAEDSVRAAIARTKWGTTLDEAPALLRDLLASPAIDLCGYSLHIGRFAATPQAYATVARAFGEAAVELQRATRFWPTLLDLGGGWARQREPESRAPELNPHTIEEHAEAATHALREALADHGSTPELWLEPGRYIVGNAVLLLARVGVVKHGKARCWIHLDASTNDLMRIETSCAWYHVMPASRMNAPYALHADLVGPTCIPSVIGSDRALPELAEDDIVAILDAGMYAEAIANQFNATPRPASVLVNAGEATLVKRRETIADLFARHIVPVRLRVS